MVGVLLNLVFVTVLYTILVVKRCVRLCGSVLAKCNWETIFCRHYRSIFNHCYIIRQQSYGIR